MSPSKERKLFHVVALDEGKNKPDETTTVEREWDETVVLNQSSQKFLDDKQMKFYLFRIDFFIIG